jgi:hypothetical protein
MLQSLPIGLVRCSTQATARLAGSERVLALPGAGESRWCSQMRWKRQYSSKSPLLITTRRARTASALDGGLLLRALADGISRLTSGQDALERSAIPDLGPQNRRRPTQDFGSAF